MNDRLHQNVSGRDGSPSCPTASRAAFTLIELMVVVALIGILIGGVFRLIGTAGEKAKRGRTVDRLQRLENALSGFYAEYGTYPPVRRQDSPDPFTETAEDLKDSDYTKLDADGKFAYRGARASHCQPMAFEFPTPQSMDASIPQLFGSGKEAANVNPGGFDGSSDSWEKTKLFRYGALSFLLPRLLVMGIAPDKDGNIIESSLTPKLSLFNKAIWNNYNLGKVRNGKLDKDTFLKQNERESITCGRLLPNLERIVYGGKTLLGVNTAEPEAGYPMFGVHDKIVLGRMTVFDGFGFGKGNEIYYYSAPPYQSYRIWSAGPDGKTFPPWIPLEDIKSVEDRKKVNGWIKDDIARFDR